MLKKLKYCLLMVLCISLLAACSKSEEKEDEKEDKEEWAVNDIYEGYSVDGNKITTVYGTVEFEDYTDLQARKSDMTVTAASKTATVSSLLQSAGAEEVNDEFIADYCKWKGINNQDELNQYVYDAIYMVNAYKAVWGDIAGKFTLTDYSQECYDAVYAEIEEDYNAQAQQIGFDSLEAYCEAAGITIEDFRKSAYDVESIIKERIVNLVVVKEQGIELTEEQETRVLENVAFQSGLTSAEDAKKQIGDSNEDLQLTTVNYLLLEWIAKNVKVVDDLEAEGATVDQTAGPQTGDTVAEITIKDFGVVKIRLFSDLAPKAVENFATHSKDGYYNGLIFHRVIDNFMIQGGDPSGDGTGGKSIWGEYFEDEFSIQLLPIRGALCMANAGDDTNGSQFFIIQSTDTNDTYAANWLEMGVSEALVNYYKENGGYGSLYKEHTVFGQVYEGMDVIDAIAETETDDSDKPKTDVVIESINISTY